tara:strand:- start:15444 stop:16229 length:786 start_codon:yes stop_codon:yes gene_type:complete
MKNIVIIPAIKPKDSNLDKFGGWGWMQYSIDAWTYWCNKHGYELVVYDTPSIEDTTKFRVTVQRWFDVFNFLDERQVEYDQICMVDASYIPKWNCPDFFKLTDNKFTATHEFDNLKWLYESIQGYKHMFNGHELDIYKYFNTGFVVFNKTHRHVFETFKEVYTNQVDEFYDIQCTLRRGTDQTPVNYVMDMNKIEIKFLPLPYRVSHLPRKDLLSHNWQLKEDTTPFFIKYGYIWGFSGFDKTQRNKLMSQTWELIKDKYE